MTLYIRTGGDIPKPESYAFEGGVGDAHRIRVPSAMRSFVDAQSGGDTCVPSWPQYMKHRQHPRSKTFS